MTSSLHEKHPRITAETSEQSTMSETEAQSMEEIQAHFKEAFRWHPAGVSVITADSPSGPVGMTATSVCSVSLSPPALTFSLSALSTTAPALMAAESVVVHLFDSTGKDVAQRFATSGIDRFEETAWSRLPSGEPLLAAATSWFRAQIAETVEIGGSTVVVVEILSAGQGGLDGQRGLSGEYDEAQSDDDAGHNGVPLVYCNRTWHGLSPDSALD